MTSLFKNKKILSFLSAFQEEIELQKSDLKIVSFKYRGLLNFFGDNDDVKKYLMYLNKKGIVRLKHISKIKTKDKKIEDDYYISKAKPENDLLTGDEFFKVMRYHKIHYYPEDLFIFEFNKKKIKNFLRGLNRNYNKAELNLSDFSVENLKRIQKFLKIVLDELELQGINELAGNKIPMEKFEKEGFSRDDILTVLNRINEGDKLIRLRLIEESSDFTNLEFYPPKTELEKMEFLAQKRAESERYISFIVINLEKLKEIKENIDEKLKEKAKTYVEAIKTQFKEKERIEEIVEEKLKKERNRVKILKTEKGKSLITRDKNGDFYYKNKLIKFENKDAIYYLIFECLYETEDINGFRSYEAINRYLEKNGKEEYTDERQIKDRIKNGVASLFRFSNLPKKTPTGKEMIDIIRGKGLALNNPKI